MSDLFILGAFVAAIALLVVMIAKFKVHPVFTLFLVVAVLALLFGTGGSATPDLINEGFGNTMASVGLLVIFGCVLGKLLETSGAALRITKATEKLLGTRRKMPWGIALASTIIGIPLIADTVVVMLIPVVSAMAARSKESMMKFGPILYIGAYVTTSLIIPGPGPLAAAGVLEVDFGQTILWGLVVAVPAIAAATFYLTRIKTYVAPKEEFVASVVAAPATVQEARPVTAQDATATGAAATGAAGGTDTTDARTGAAAVTTAPREDDDVVRSAYTGKPVSLGLSLLPIWLPIVLIMIDSLVTPRLAEGSPAAEVIGFVGAPIVALALGLVVGMPLFGSAWKEKRVLTDMFDAGLRTAALPIALTGVGGALALLIRNTEVADRLAAGIESSGFPAIVVPFLVGAIICTITGSNILGMLTSAAVMAPLVDVLGISALAVFLACGSGAQIMKHANSSGFWVTTTLSNLSVGQAIRSIGVASVISGVTSFAVTCVLYYTGVI